MLACNTYDLDMLLSMNLSKFIYKMGRAAIKPTAPLGSGPHFLIV